MYLSQQKVCKYCSAFLYFCSSGKLEHAKIIQSGPIQKRGARINILARNTHSLFYLGYCWLQNRED